MAEDRERDLVLSPNEFAYVLDRTKGLVSCIAGAYKLSLSNSDVLVTFDETSKRFIETGYTDAVQTFITAPENWYIQLKNPAKEGKHPTPGTSNTLPELEIGRKINIPGSISFALYPGQMAKVIPGHRLHSNQYLLARIYDASLFKSSPQALEVGQLMVIKGTEKTFYIPPTGIEVVPLDNGEYVRDAVTLERLEYCILKNEGGEKKYVHGPAVVFPEPDEVFVINDKDLSYKFKAIELSDISGIYVKVIADYTDDAPEELEVIGYEEVENEDGDIESIPLYAPPKSYKAGEELFLTGKDQMIYYPRPEHAIITYEGNVLHHAVAIPAGEGRYVLNRLTGDIKTVTGPIMYLPDPRFEVIVKRKLTDKQCKMWYPGNSEVYRYNTSDNDNGKFEYALNLENCSISLDSLPRIGTQLSAEYEPIINSSGFGGQGDITVESKAGFSRGNTYTKPRMITIDNRFDGVVSISVWSGFAVEVVDKRGGSRVVVGPQTVLLDYDETLTVVNDEVYLKIDERSELDTFIAQTSDFVDVKIYTRYVFKFTGEMGRWFRDENYVNTLSETERAFIIKEIKKHSIEDVYANCSEIVSNAVLGKNAPKFGNGMVVTGASARCTIEDSSLCEMFDRHQFEMVRKALSLSSKTKENEISNQIIKLDQEHETLQRQAEMVRIQEKYKIDAEQASKDSELARAKEETKRLAKEAEKLLAQLDAEKDKITQEREVEYQKALAQIEAEKGEAEAKRIREIMDAISPDLVAAISATTGAETLRAVAENLSPYLLANGSESVSELINRLVRGTSLESIVNKVLNN